MPTSAAGNSRRRATRGAGGFTLFELLVVVAIIAFGTAGVAMSLRDSGQTALDREGERLSALLESARAQSRATGVAVRWHTNPNGPGDFAFEGLPPQSLPTGWLAAGIVAQPIGPDGQAVPALQLGPEPVIAAQQVELSTEGPPARNLRIGTDGLHPFAIVSPP